MSDVNSGDEPVFEPVVGFQGWTPFAVMFHPDGEVASVVGPDEGDPYSLLGNGDIWSFDAAERDGEWIKIPDLSIESGVVAGRAAAAYNALLSLNPDPDRMQPGEMVARLVAFVRLWTADPLNQYILREMSCELLASVAALVDIVDSRVAFALLRQHADAADREWNEPELCSCRTRTDLSDPTLNSDH